MSAHLSQIATQLDTIPEKESSPTLKFEICPNKQVDIMGFKCGISDDDDDDDDEHKHSSIIFRSVSLSVPWFFVSQPMPVALDLEPSCKKFTKRISASWSVGGAIQQKRSVQIDKTTGIGSKLQGTNISPLKVAGKMIFLFHRWDMLVPRRVFVYRTHSKCFHLCFVCRFFERFLISECLGVLEA